MNVGILGTGLMGAPIAQRLQQQGETVAAYNRSPAKLMPLAAAGITIATTPAHLIELVDVVVLMLSDACAIADTLLSRDALAQLSGKTVLQMGTISPSQSRAIAKQVAKAGGEYLEATVLGSIPEVKTGTLLVMVGATTAQFDRHLPLLQHLGQHPKHIGEVGSATAMKLALNQLIGSLTTAFSLSLHFIQRQGLAVDDFMEVLRQSALYAPTFDKKLARMLASDYKNPNFPTQHLRKDLGLFAEEAQALNLDTATIAAIQTLLNRALEQNLAEGDYSALHETIAQP